MLLQPAWMRRIIILLALLACLDVSAQPYTASFTPVNIFQQPQPNRLCSIQAWGLGVSVSNNPVLQDIGSYYTDNNGVLWLTNPVPANYLVTVKAPPQATQIYFFITNNLTQNIVISNFSYAPTNATNWQVTGVNIVNVSGSQAGLGGQYSGGVLSLTNTNGPSGSGTNNYAVFTNSGNISAGSNIFAAAAISAGTVFIGNGQDITNLEASNAFAIPSIGGILPANIVPVPNYATNVSQSPLTNAVTNLPGTYTGNVVGGNISGTFITVPVATTTNICNGHLIALVHNGTTTYYDAVHQTPLSYGDALCFDGGALANAVAGDTIYLNVGVFDLADASSGAYEPLNQSQLIDLTANATGSVSLIGAGSNYTVLNCDSNTLAANENAQGYSISFGMIMGPSSLIANLSMTAQAQIPILEDGPAMAGLSGGNNYTVVSNVYASGAADVYDHPHTLGNPYKTTNAQVKVYNTIINGAYDTWAVSGTNTNTYIFNNLTSFANTSGAYAANNTIQTQARGIAFETTNITATFSNCTLTAVGNPPASGAYLPSAALWTETNNKVSLYSTTLSASGSTTNFSIYSGSGTATVGMDMASQITAGSVATNVIVSNIGVGTTYQGTLPYILPVYSGTYYGNGLGETNVASLGGQWAFSPTNGFYTTVGTPWTNKTSQRGFFTIPFSFTSGSGTGWGVNCYVTNYSGAVGASGTVTNVSSISLGEGGLTALTQTGSNFFSGFLYSNSVVNLVSTIGTITALNTTNDQSNIVWQ